MEVIEKKISLEFFKSRHPSLIPFYDVENQEFCLDLKPNGNWGKYPCDIDILLCENFSSLYNVFGNRRVSFRQITEKWYFFQDFLKKTIFYTKVIKGGESLWVEYSPLTIDKIGVDIVVDLEVASGGFVGVNEFAEEFNINGGWDMYLFVLKALGMFLVDKKYLVDGNYVPEIMYYDGVENYYNMLKKIQKNENCCGKTEFDRYGGSEFIVYLSSKLIEKESEFIFWKNALFRQNGNYVTSEIVLPLGIVADFNNIGMLTIVEPIPEYDYINKTEVEYDIEVPIYPENLRERKWVTDSSLATLKKTQQTFAFNKLRNVEFELPVILESVGDEGLFFKLSPKYETGRAVNLSVVDGKMYGDVIYSMFFNDSEGQVYVKYVIGGELTIDSDGRYLYDENSLTGIRFEEKLKFEYHDYANDKTVEIKQLLGTQEVNILEYNRVQNANNVLIVYDNEITEVEGTFYVDYPNDLTNYKVIGIDYNLGKTEGLIENIEDIIIDRGYTSAFELHYKMGEINSFEELTNYQNNIFGV